MTTSRKNNSIFDQLANGSGSYYYGQSHHITGEVRYLSEGMGYGFMNGGGSDWHQDYQDTETFNDSPHAFLLNPGELAGLLQFRKLVQLLTR